MLDVLNIPRPELNNWVFYTKSSSIASTSDWQVWQKPRNVKFVSFFVIGGGAGGAGGQATAATARTGGGGGGSSAYSKGIFQADLLPDILYIQVGVGGSGGASVTNGGSGSISYVSVEPTINTTDVVLASGAAAPTFGTSAGLGGNAGTVFAQTAGFYSYWGIINTTAGQVGAAGGANTGGGGNSITAANSITLGGAGGGGSSTAAVNGAGGSIVATTVTQVITGGAAGGANAGQTGIASFIPSLNSSNLTVPFLTTGGAGGGANGAAGQTGGAGGNGSFGSGGGGGGAGATAGGAGGSGGDGIVIINCW